MIRLDRASRDHHPRSLFLRLRNKEFQFARLVAAESETSLVVALDENPRPAQQLRKDAAILQSVSANEQIAIAEYPSGSSNRFLRFLLSARTHHIQSTRNDFGIHLIPKRIRREVPRAESANHFAAQSFFEPEYAPQRIIFIEFIWRAPKIINRNSRVTLRVSWLPIAKDNSASSHDAFHATCRKHNKLVLKNKKQRLRQPLPH